MRNRKEARDSLMSSNKCGLPGTIMIALLISMTALSGCSSLTLEQARQPESAALSAETLQRYKRALAMMAKADYQHALPDLNAVIDIWPDRAGPRFNLGIAYYHLDRIDDAMASLQSAVKLDPDLAAAHNLIGILERQAGAFDASRKAYERAIKADSKYANAELNLAILYDIYLRRPEDALTHYDRFMALNDGHDDAVAQWVTDLKTRIKKQADKAADGRTP
ncbi:MAG: tetratricopeptide repeat protein [Gammaproteobacteria bacterium]|nr:tetratricopeptide repeat protein [Gammaproteobacteria bacterium]